MSFGAACIIALGGGVMTGAGAIAFAIGVRFLYLALTTPRL
jgi:hypothetical protein